MTEKNTKSSSEWSISKFYSDAWKLTLTHKKLWILGFAVAIYASGGMSQSNNFHNSQTSSSSSSTSKTHTQRIGKSLTVPLSTPEKTPQNDKIFNDVIQSTG